MADITAGKRPDELPGRADITVGLRVPHELPGGAAGLRDFAARAEATGIDRLFVGDHVTFRGGHGFDGLLNAAALAVASRGLPCRQRCTSCPCAIRSR